MKEWRQLYNFWFGVPGTPESRLTARLPLWFLKDPEADQRSREEFAPWLADFAAGRLDHWLSDPRGTLSLVILLDQIPRNAFRGQPDSFSYDKEALRVALDAIERGIDEQLSTLERLFLYLPLEHSEELAMQRLSVAKFESLHESACPELGEFTRVALDYAVKHQTAIERFGRYPHRNAILGRASTRAETDFLQDPGNSF